MPDIPGMDVFKATSTTRPNTPGPTPTAARGGRHRSNNSAHDICAALWEVGADVTMVQRSSTHVSRSDSLMELGLGALYSESAVESA